MQHSVAHVKVKRQPQRNQQKQEAEPNSVSVPIGPRSMAVRNCPQQNNFVECPNTDTTEQRPEHVVINLMPECKTTAELSGVALFVFVVGALQTPCVEIQVKTAGEQQGV